MVMPRALGRHVEHDPQSRDFAYAEPIRTPRDVIWPRYSQIIDQGELGCCTGAAMTGWLGCTPHCADPAAAAIYGLEYAHGLYSLATRLDVIPGQWPDEDTGSTGNAVAKAARQLGEIRSYSWAFTTASLLHALQYGPVIAGVPWYSLMSEPDSTGRIHIGGQVEGGHEILIRGLQSEHLLIDNSWGASWGQRGSCWLHLRDWARLRQEQADVTIPHP
jgi:hypothetical protein